jgi:uncharacterized protein YndB with AHSA1/START domain
MLITSRVIDAPREIVFEAWTSPAHLGAWWGPTGFTTTTSAFDMRPGGVWRFVMHGPDGRDYENRIVFEEIVRPEYIRYRHDDGDDDEIESVRFTTEVMFEEVGGKTRITLAGEFPSKEERDRVVREYGAAEGAVQTLARLDEYARSFAERSLPVKRITLVRMIDAPRALVWSAWTEPERLKAWWGPKGFTAPRCKLEIREGGAYDVEMMAPDGSHHPVKGIIRHLTPPEHLVFSAWVHGAGPDGAGEGAVEVLNSITLIEKGAATQIIVEAMVVSAPDPALFAGMEEGWAQAIEKLAASLH